jgi:hypothetical protein
MILAMPIEALSEADLDRLEQSTIPEETQEAQLPSSLESGRRRSVPRSRRPQMFEEIHLCAGPFFGPSYCARKYLPRINKRLEWECGGQPSQLHRLPLTSSDVSKSRKIPGKAIETRGFVVQRRPGRFSGSHVTEGAFPGASRENRTVMPLKC